MAAYGSAKAGLNQLTRILAAEFAPKVRVNAIVVGQIDTPGAAAVLSDEMKREAAARIPMQRIGARDRHRRLRALPGLAGGGLGDRPLDRRGRRRRRAHGPRAFPMPPL